jgi:hypothetical protein
VLPRLDVRDTPTHEESYAAIAAGSDEGATPARAGFVVAVLVLASHLPDARVGVAIAGLVPVPEAALAAGSIPAIDDRRCFGRHVLGVHEYRGWLSR